MAYEFHYTPTGTGVISGKEVLEQTEDAINDLGNTAISGVQEALDKAEQALTNSENAVDDAQTALNTANNAEGVAIQAQNDVSNLSGTVTNIGNRVTTAEGNIGNLQGRMTTAEGNITNLQGRMTTAEGNIGNLQTAVSTAQATANSAQQTATTARQQSYVFRYSSTALTASSTNSNALLDNTDNLKVGDKVIDSSGVLFSITAIDTANSTFSIGTALIDLANDSDVVHKSGNETVGGVKTFTDSMQLKSNVAEYGVTSGNIQMYLMDKNNVGLSKINQGVFNNGASYIALQLYGRDSNNQTVTSTITYQYSNSFNNTSLVPNDNNVWLGSPNKRWSKIYGTEYYYGSNNVEFSTKFVTTDTAQTISGNKTFLDVPISFKSSTAELGVSGGNTKVIFTDKNLLNLAGITFGNYGSSKLSYCRFHIYDKDSNNQEVENFIEFSYVNNNQFAYFRPNKSNFVTLGTVNNRWYKVYANEYYYGSDNVEFSTKFVTTDTAQTISESKTFTNTIKSQKEIEFTGNRLAYILPEFSAGYSGLSLCTYGSNGAIKIGAWKVDDNDNTKHILDSSLGYLNVSIGSVNNVNIAYVTPRNTTDSKLGDSVNKWKSFNGVEPSSLSLPSGNLNDVIDISSYITDLSGYPNNYVAPSNGFISISATGTGLNMLISGMDLGVSLNRSTSGSIKHYIPILKGQTVRILVIASSLEYVKFIPCQGNV